MEINNNNCKMIRYTRTRADTFMFNNTQYFYLMQNKLSRSALSSLHCPNQLWEDFLRAREHFKANLISKMAHRAYKRAYERIFPHVQVAVNPWSQRLEKQCRMNGNNQRAFKSYKLNRKMRLCQQYLIQMKPYESKCMKAILISYWCNELACDG